QWLMMTRLVGVAIAFCVSCYTVLAFTLSYLLIVREEEPQTAYASVLVVIIIGSLACPLFGAWSDRVGRKPLLIGACVAMVLFADRPIC
ncbi:MAG: MFS transporter, partial [Actinomycetota bacterium]|nr:MFS transporter [Actinomycetota bacterium]